ncbi:MAG: hypothetical protein JWN21_2035 [Sphingomonas bacterium]|uniref:hypothetical protein n=1 Tax=Sphingomonas bacterium TaxID=1895847 RepID=UPI002628D9EF|nr:hypothetical protein [Sphingomonas bacterium]MDB5696492.1 hypothetical protein [Sphingomonas bacterium]
MMPPLLRLSVGVAAGIAMTLGAQLALGQGVAGGFRQTAETPIQRLNAAVQQLGIRNCAPVFSQAGAFLFEDAAAQFVIQPLGPDTNRWPTVVTMEGTHPVAGRAPAAGQTRLTTLIVAPAGSCAGMYNQVIYWPEPCPAIKARVFKSYGSERPLLARVRQSEANPGLQLYLMPAGVAGCVSVKKELIG